MVGILLITDLMEEQQIGWIESLCMMVIGSWGRPLNRSCLEMFLITTPPFSSILISYGGSYLLDLTIIDLHMVILMKWSLLAKVNPYSLVWKLLFWRRNSNLSKGFWKYEIKICVGNLDSQINSLRNVCFLDIRLGQMLFPRRKLWIRCGSLRSLVLFKDQRFLMLSEVQSQVVKGGDSYT